MDGALLKRKVYAGFEKAAQRVGLPYDVYRPTSVSNPMSVGNKIATLSAAFTIHASNEFNFSKPSDYSSPLFHALIDPTNLKVGDYLSNPNDPLGPFFVISMEPSKPPLVVQTNRVVTLTSPISSSSSVGLQAYHATTITNGTTLMVNWPASVLLKSGAKKEKQLPSDAGHGAWRILLPYYRNVLIRPGTIITDDLNNRMVVQIAELQNFGWRIDVEQAVT